MPTTITNKKGKRQQRKKSRMALIVIFGSFSLFLILIAASIWFLSNPNQEQEVPKIGGPFQLINGDGQAVTDRTFRGKYMLIYFGYTFCPDVCPTTLQNIAAALDQLGSRGSSIQPIFITVDPQRDTASIMKQYTAAFSPKLLGLTGTGEQIKETETVYHVYAQQRPADIQGRGYTVDHSSVLYLMGPEGQFIAPLRADEPSSAITADLELYAHLSKE